MKTLLELSNITDKTPLAKVLDPHANALMEQYRQSTYVNYLGKSVYYFGRNSLKYVLPTTIAVGLVDYARNGIGFFPVATLLVGTYLNQRWARGEANEEYNGGIRAKIPALADEKKHVYVLVKDIETSVKLAVEPKAQDFLRERIQAVKDEALAILRNDYRQAGFGRWESSDLVRPLEDAVDTALLMLKPVVTDGIRPDFIGNPSTASAA
ncbi:MAG: hypothetical protein KDK78_06360 [Chlamydiia bacterium]|nr:hypothetical protein [Chlamydiia bacterium]